MKQNQKKEIQALLQEYVGQFDSQKQAIARLKNTSEATVINILKGRWEGISDEMFRQIGKQVNWNSRALQPVETMNFQTLVLYFSLAQEEGATFALVGDSGWGKSYAGKWYSEVNRNKNVYYLECADYWNKKMFLSRLLEKMGKQNTGYNSGEMMEIIIDTLRKQEQPLIILDEVDKLNDTMLYFFITLYNELNGLCGIVWTSTDNIEKRIIKGLKLNRKGYKEIFSRLGRKFVHLPGTNFKEIVALCHENGITDQAEVQEIYNDYEGDLRRVDRAFLKKAAAAKRKSQLKTA